MILTKYPKGLSSWAPDIHEKNTEGEKGKFL